MSDLPNLLDSIYASLPSQLLSSPSDSISGRRLSGSVEVEPVGMARMPISYWRTLIARIKAGLENAL